MAATAQGQLYDLAEQFARALADQDQAAHDVLVEAWAAAYERISEEYGRVVERIEAAREAGEDLSPAWLMRRTRLSGILGQTLSEIDRYAELASAQVIAAQQAAMSAATGHAATLGAAAVAEAGLVASFLAIDPRNLEVLAGFMADGTPVADMFAGMGEEVTDGARRIFSQAVATGKHPSWIARQLDAVLDIPRQRATTIARTESLRVYRETTRQTYQANSDTIGTWVWSAQLDDETCMACTVMDGTEHPLDARLDGHPNCRCAMIPRTPSWADLLGEEAAEGIADTRPELRKGVEWFEEQSALTQRRMLGPLKFSAWQRGDISLTDVVAQTHSPRWGSMRRVRSMREIREGVNANTGD